MRRIPWTCGQRKLSTLKCRAAEDGVPQLHTIPPERIRNFGIIAHIDHGKSTLADCLLRLTGCLVGGSPTAGPTLDTLPVERERGITVKAQTASMFYRHEQVYMLNLIDTPGHADFTYEVARSLAAMQGALLMVDAAAGVQAQTVAHYWRARDYGVSAIVPVINKVDLPQADVDLVMEQLQEQLGIDTSETPVLAVSAKTGLGVEKVLPTIIERVPPPMARVDRPFEASLVDCWYREFRGVICLVSVRGGTIKPGDAIKSVATEKLHVVEEVGILQPGPVRTDYLHAGQVGYVRCGMKNTHDALIGDTFIAADATKPANVRLPQKLRPIVFAGMFPARRDEYETVLAAVEKLLLNDSSVCVEKIASTALGPGWRLGFLGSLHMDVFGQRLQQEFGVNVVLTAPNVSYEATFKDGTVTTISSAEEYPSEKAVANVKQFREPIVKATIILPTTCIGAISSLCSELRCGETVVEYLSADRVKVTVEMPLVEIIGDFNNRLLSITAGYASFDYEPAGMRPVELVKIGIRLNGDPVDILGTIQPRERASAVGRTWTRKLAGLLPRQQFAIAIQAVIGAKTIIAREDVSAVRKDVIAKCYGGDKTRKMKLLEAQKEGKARMRMLGKVEIPHDAFVKIMRLSSTDP